MAPEQAATNKARRRGAWALWIGVTLMFLLVISAWIMLIKIAQDNPVEPIEVESNIEHPTSNAQR